MAAPVVKINAVSYPVLTGTLRISHRVHARSTATFTLIDETAANHFDFNEPVTILGLDGVTTIFAGWIDDVREKAWATEGGSSNGLMHRIACKDNHYLADKRLVTVGPNGTPEFVSMTSGAIVEWIIDNILVDEGVTDGTIQTGLTVDRIPADHISCAEIIERVADFNGFIWKINNDRSLDFRTRTSVSASISPDGTNMLRDSVEVHRRNFSYRNKQYILASDTAVASTQPLEQGDNAIEGDGSTREFVFPVYFAHVFRVEVSTDGGTTWAVDTIEEVFEPGDGFVSANWQFSLWDNTLYHDAAETVLAAGDFVRAYGHAYPSIQTHDFAGDGSLRYTLPFYIAEQPRDDPPRILVDYGNTGTFVRETCETIGQGESEPATDWYVIARSNQLIRLGASPPTSADTIRAIYASFAVSDIEFANSDEIARNKAIEGNTTSGIVESVITDYESTSAAESNQHALAELNRWSHDTLELEFETWDGRLTDGEVVNVDLSIHDINSEQLLIDEVVVRDRPARGAQNAKDSPLLYRVTAIKSPTVGASGGAIGRAANPRRFSDLFRQLNDRVRLPVFRQPESFTIPPTEEDDLTPAEGTPPDESLDDGGFAPRIWLAADEITGLADSDPVVTWTDLSTFGHDFTQATAANRPLYKTNRVNSLPAVLFDGSNDTLQCASPRDAHIRVDSTVFAVLRFTASSPAGHQGLFTAREFRVGTDPRCSYIARRQTADGGEFSYWNNEASWHESGFAPLTGTWYLFTWEVSESDNLIWFYLNGVEQAEVSLASVPSQVDDALASYWIGSHGDGGDFLKGEIAELVTYGDTMHDSAGEEREQVEAWLMDKYGL